MDRFTFLMAERCSALLLFGATTECAGHGSHRLLHRLALDRPFAGHEIQRAYRLRILFPERVCIVNGSCHQARVIAVTLMLFALTRQ